jgi:hypothetical protein
VDTETADSIFVDQTEQPVSQAAPAEDGVAPWAVEFLIKKYLPAPAQAPHPQ